MALIRPTSFWRAAHPRGAIADFVTVWRQAGSKRWGIAAISAACTISIFSVMWQEEAHGPPRPPKVTYIRTWAPHRTDAAEQMERDERVREIYKTLGRLSGMDVDAIEKKAMAERAAQERAEAAGHANKPDAAAQ